MQATVSSAGNADSYALLLILKHQLDSRRVVRHFVCSECMGMVRRCKARVTCTAVTVLATSRTCIRLPPRHFNGVSG